MVNEMTKILSLLPFAVAIFYQVMFQFWDRPALENTGLLCSIVLAAIWPALRARGEASPIHLGFCLFVFAATAGTWLLPAGAYGLLVRYATGLLYVLLFLVALVPLLLGRPGFTTFFARRSQPAELWETEGFKTINRHLSWFWTILFLAAALSVAIPGLEGLPADSPYRTVFEVIIPLVLTMGLGIVVTKRYPDYYLRRQGLADRGEKATPAPPGKDGDQSFGTCRELLKMMPRGFNAQAAGDLEAVIQFEVSQENFTAHLVISGGSCTHQEGPAQRPDLVIKTPAQVWLDISEGRKQGQAAFTAGEFTAEGDLGILLRLDKLFSR